ncbi:MAG: AAA family ATPase [Bacteroidota bacterium]|nr:AAA family ATPase [Bacteroidota bacterium]
MKIKQIKINGIRGFCFWKDKDNSPNPHLIKPDGKHLFIYGENGTGKSSFFDSLEWCLTGNTPECKNRRILSQDDFLKNIFNNEEDIPYVEVSFNSPDENSYKRELKKGAHQIPFEHEEQSQVNFIESNRIEEFVVDTPRSLWERFLILLGLDDLIQLRAQLIALKSENDRDQQNKESVYADSEKNFSELKNEVEKLKENLKSIIGENWETSLDDSKLKEYEKFYKQFETIEDKGKSLLEKYRSIELLNTERKHTSEFLRIEKEKIETPIVVKVINEAYEYFDSVENINECPVCTKPLDKGELTDVVERLKSLKDGYNNFTTLEKKLEDINGRIDLQNEDIRKSKPTFIKEYSKSNNTDLSNKSDDELFKYLSKELTNITNSKEKYFNLIKNNNLQEIGAYKSKKEEFEKTKTRYEKTLKEYELSKKVNKQIENGINEYKAKYIEKITQGLSTIGKNKVTSIYNKINKSTNENIIEFDIIPDIEKEEISFKAKLRGTGQWEDALTILSTGHLRCLGFALLVTRLKENNPKLKFIVIDDPIYSIDHEHRYNLVQHFLELSSEYQLIITTSDLNFFDILRNSFAEPLIRVYKTFFSQENSTELGKCLIKQTTTNYINEAEGHLNLMDFRAAALYSRLALETKILELAKKIKIEIPINRIDKISIKVIFDSNFKTKLIEKFADREEDINSELSKLQHHRYFKSLIMGFPLDELIHFPDDQRGFIYSTQEIHEVIDTVKEFILFSDTLLQKQIQ